MSEIITISLKVSQAEKEMIEAIEREKLDYALRIAIADEYEKKEPKWGSWTPE